LLKKPAVPLVNPNRLTLPDRRKPERQTRNPNASRLTGQPQPYFVVNFVVNFVDPRILHIKFHRTPLHAQTLPYAVLRLDGFCPTPCATMNPI